MVENRTRGEQLFEQAKGRNPTADGGKSLKAKVSGLFGNLRDLFGKPQAKGPSGAQKAGLFLSGIFSAQKLDLRVINQTLAVVLAGLIALTAYSTLRQRPSVASVTAAVSKIKFEDLEEKTVTAFQDLAFYLDQIKTRDIFNEYEEPKPPPPVVVEPVELPPPPPPPPPKVTIQDKARNLKLMGISWGDSPKVIIRNEGTQEVHFLKEGEKIKETEIRVKKIFKNEVILSSDGDEMKML